MMKVSPEDLEREESIHRFDLQQIETITKLHHRLGRELVLYNKLTQQMAYQEGAMTAAELKLSTPAIEPNGEDNSLLNQAQSISDLEDQQIKMLKLMKGGIWQIADKLRATHIKQRSTRELEVVNGEE